MSKANYGLRKVFLLSMFMWGGYAYAQNVSTQLYNFNNVGQTTLLNPATKVQSNVTISLFHLGLQLNTPNINLADIFTKNQNTNETINSFLSSPNKNLNNISLSMQSGMFFGFRILKKNYFSLGAYADVSLHLNAPKDLLSVVANGTTPYIGQTIALAPDIFSTINLVYHLGYSRQITQALTLGMRLKLITGVQSVRSEGELNLSIANNDPNNNNTYRYTLQSNYALRMNNFSQLAGGGNMDVASLLFANEINGFGLDFGVNYKINKRWSVSASVLDLGFIDWKKDVASLQKRGVDHRFDGLVFESLNSLLTQSGGVGKKLDSMVKAIGLDTVRHAYQTSLNGKFYLGGEFWLFPKTKVGATFFGFFHPFKNGFDYAFSLSATQKLWSILDIRLGWNIYNHDPANLGLGLSLNLGYFQIYAMTENIIPVFRYDQAHRFNLQLGVNFNFGLNLDKDGDGVPNKEDKCVKIFGLEKFDGCPDTDRDSVPDYKDSCRLDSGAVFNKGCPLKDKDGDSIYDIYDSCPDIKGLKSTFGCPDKDGDSVADQKDSCPNVKGDYYANGCPDTDGDAIADHQDSCKLMAGRSEFFGCPTKEALKQSRYDNDGDNVPDSLDRCPGLAGSSLLNGCPDYDGDGVPDDQDSCMEISGELVFNGCPDTDGDKVPDYLDRCITLSGTIQNNGCPKSIGKNIFTESSNKNQTTNSRGTKNGTIQNNDGTSSSSNTSPKDEADGSLIKSLALNPQQSNVLVQAFKNLNFRFQSATILESSYPVLDELATLLQSKPSARLVLIGYTDNLGDDVFNQNLSYQRANSVKKYLVDKGVSNTIELYGFGENNPVADNETPQGRSRNRRVEMAILESGN